MLRLISRLFEKLLHVMRRIEPLYRPLFDRLLRMPLTRFFNWTINLTRSRNVPPIGGEAVDPDDLEMLEDMVVAAINDAMQNAETLSADKMAAITGGIKIPGLT